jgi:hypothetical protein
MHPSSSSFAHRRWHWIGSRSDGAAKIPVDYRIRYSLANPDNRLSTPTKNQCLSQRQQEPSFKAPVKRESFCCSPTCGRIYLIPLPSPIFQYYNANGRSVSGESDAEHLACSKHRRLFTVAQSRRG